MYFGERHSVTSGVFCPGFDLANRVSLASKSRCVRLGQLYMGSLNLAFLEAAIGASIP